MKLKCTGKRILGMMLASMMVLGNGVPMEGIVTVASAAEENQQPVILEKTPHSVTIGIQTSGTCGLFITSDRNKTTFANVGYAGDMQNANGYAQWHITNRPVADGAGFTSESLQEGDWFRYWIRMNTSAGQVMMGPYEYTHQLDDTQGEETSPSGTEESGTVSESQTGESGTIQESSAEETGGSGTSSPVDVTVSTQSVQPKIDWTLETDYSFMYFTLSNSTNGMYADDQIYITILGREWNDNPEQPFSYMTADGRLPLVSTRTNDKSKMMYNPWSGLVDTKRIFTNLGFTIADVKALGQIDQNGNAYIKVPPIRSGRMYLSYGEDICIEIKGADFAGPALDNPTDPNQDVIFDFVEFTYNDIGQFWGNTTRVDGYVFPINIRLVGTEDDLDADGNVQWLADGTAKQKPVDKWVGDLGTAAQIFAKWNYETRKGTLFEKFNHLLQKDHLGNDTRIIAPGKGEFDKNETGLYKDYFDAYITSVWDTYTNPFDPSNPMVMTTQAGRFVQTGTAASAPGCNGNYALKDGALLMVFKHEVWNKTTGGWYEPYPERRYYIHKPSTAEVLEGKGAFDHHHAQGYDDTCDLVIESQMCAAFNRGVAHLNEDINTIYSTNPSDPEGTLSQGCPIAPWGDVSKYYVADSGNQGVFNFYAMFWHRYGVNSKAYGFCYDDVWEQSTLLYARYAHTLAIDFYNQDGNADEEDPTESSTEEGSQGESSEAENSQTETMSAEELAAIKPDGVTAVYQNGTVVLHWNDCGAVRCKVSRSDGRSGYTNLTYRASAEGWTDETVESAQLYYYRITPYFMDASGNLVSGMVSDAAVVVATDRLPDKVVNVQAATASGQVTLTWDKAEGARYYKVSRASGATGKYYTMKYNILENSYTDTSVSKGLYRYKVVGYYKDVDGSWVYGDLCDTLYVTVK